MSLTQTEWPEEQSSIMFTQETDPESARSSWAYSSKRSTQSSFASSRTSYSSNLSYYSNAPYSGIPPPLPGLQYAAPRQSQPNVPLPDPTRQATPDIQARCPWCRITFTRRHDFKQHARSFHLSRIYWQCRSIDCQERTFSERQAKMHSNQTGRVSCKNLMSTKNELHCDRKHFGCPHCSAGAYFQDSEEFLAHLALECSPKRATRSPHQSLQVRGLLQQPALIAKVELLCSQLRGDRTAYRRLWWSFSKSFMSNTIEKLEYGVKAEVDLQNPGLREADVDGFLYLLLAPSEKAIYETEVIRTHRSPSLLAPEKPLPPLPNEAWAQPSTSDSFDQNAVFRDTRGYLHQGTSWQPSAATSLYASSVDEWRLKHAEYDPMIGGSFCQQQSQADEFETLHFEWQKLEGGLDEDPTTGGPFR